MAPPLRMLLAALAAAAPLAGCGGAAGLGPLQPSQGSAAGYASVATKNTTRVAGSDPIVDAAAVASAVYPSLTPETHPPAIALVDSRDWRAALAATVLMSTPIRAPILFSSGGDLPAATSAALAALKPTGGGAIGYAQVIRVGDAPSPSGLRATTVSGVNDFALAAALDRFARNARGSTSRDVVIASADAPQYALPAAGWAALSGDPLLYVTRTSVPAETVAAIRLRRKPRIYVLGPVGAIAESVVARLRRLGSVKRIRGNDPIANAIAFARYSDAGFGWDVVNPGHGLVFVNPGRPLDAAAAAPLSSSGTYGPLLLTDAGATLPLALRRYLLDIEPGFRQDPVRGVYNHGWLVGDQRAISAPAQAQIDALLEIAPVAAGSAP